MAKQQQYQPPRRKEPGLIGQAVSALVQLVIWLVISLMLSIVIEWIGMVWFWPEQGAEQLYNQSLTIKKDVIATTQESVSWIARQSWLKTLLNKVPDVPEGSFSSVEKSVHDLYQQHRDHLQASTYVTQTFVIRLALILFSLPIFALAVLIGAVDGLVERDLRRWGGGRESSNVFNLARRSVVPSFVAACVVYISLPFSINPVLIIIPFATLIGLATRIAFERFKKYF